MISSNRATTTRITTATRAAAALVPAIMAAIIIIPKQIIKLDLQNTWYLPAEVDVDVNVGVLLGSSESIQE